MPRISVCLSELVLHFNLAANSFSMQEKEERGQTEMEKTRLMDMEGGQTLALEERSKQFCI